MKYLKLLLNILCWPVYICIAIFLAIAAPMVAGYRPVVVLSGSMEPTYHVGSIIYYKQTPFEDISVGDPITFRAGEDALVTHRVTQKMEISREFVTQGDANNTEDPNPVSYGEVVGRASKISLPYMGVFVNYAKQPAVIGAMVAILALGFLADQLPGGKKAGETEGKKDGGDSGAADRKRS